MFICGQISIVLQIYLSYYLSAANARTYYLQARYFLPDSKGAAACHAHMYILCNKINSTSWETNPRSSWSTQVSTYIITSKHTKVNRKINILLAGVFAEPAWFRVMRTVSDIVILYRCG